MDLNKTTIDIRKRSNWEALDLGLVFVRNSFKKLYLVWFVITFPVFLAVTICVHFIFDYSIFAVIFLFLLKPVFDRIPLFIYSNTLFAENISYKYIFKKIIPFLFKSIFLDLLIRFLIPWRIYVTPVRTLEGITWKQKKQRIRVIKKEAIGSAIMSSVICQIFEIFIYISFFSIILIFYSTEFNIISLLFEETSIWISLFIVFLYYVSVSIIEPFFVASGFSLYINRRVYLEGWDIELEFRRMKKRLQGGKSFSDSSKVIIFILLFISFNLLPAQKSFAQSVGKENTQQKIIDLDNIDEDIQEILEMPEFGEDEKKEIIRLREEFQPKYEDGVEFKEENTNSIINSIASFIASLLPWIFGILLIAAIIYILLKNNIINLKPGVSKNIILKSEIETSFLDKISLPSDIINSAKADWDKNNPIAALSLLYRGAIYYIVNLKKIFIPDYTTERENLDIVKKKLKEIEDKEILLNNFSFLTSNWQKCAYANIVPDYPTFINLCETWKNYFAEMESI